MKKWACLLGCFLLTGSVFSQKKTTVYQLKAFQKSSISGVAPSNIIEIGAPERTNKKQNAGSEYFIYLIASKETSLKVVRIWIRQQSYSAIIEKSSSLPILIQDGKKKDTLISSTNATVWKLSIMGKDSSDMKPNKELATQIKKNQLVVQLRNNSGKSFTEFLNQIQILESERRQ